MKFASFILASLVVLHVSPLALAQTEPGLGWIEGVLVTDRGEPALGDSRSIVYADNAKLTLLSATGKEIRARSDKRKGGFYTFRNLPPGIYEIFVDQTYQQVRDVATRYRPQHIFGIVVEPDKRMRLNITVHEGKGLEEIGEPTVATENVVLISDEIKRLQDEINVLKRKLSVP